MFSWVITEDQILGRAFERRQETFARLERRRESLQRAYHRTLHDLRAVQDSRAQVPLPPQVWHQVWQDTPAAPPEAPKPSAAPPLTHSSQKPKPENGFVPENPQIPRVPLDPASPVASPHTPSRAPQQPPADAQSRKDAA